MGSLVASGTWCLTGLPVAFQTSSLVINLSQDLEKVSLSLHLASDLGRRCLSLTWMCVKSADVHGEGVCQQKPAHFGVLGCLQK